MQSSPDHLDLTKDDDVQTETPPYGGPAHGQHGQARAHHSSGVRVKTRLTHQRKGDVRIKVEAWESLAVKNAPARLASLNATSGRGDMPQQGVAFNPQDPESKASRKQRILLPGGHAGPWQSSNFVDAEAGPSNQKQSRARLHASTFNDAKKSVEKHRSQFGSSGPMSGHFQPTSTTGNRSTTAASSQSAASFAPRASKKAVQNMAKGKTKAEPNYPESDDELQILDQKLQEDDIQNFSDEANGPARKKARLNGAERRKDEKRAAKMQATERRTSEDPLSMPAVMAADKIVSTATPAAKMATKMRPKGARGAPSREAKQRAASAATTADNEFDTVLASKAPNLLTEMKAFTFSFDNLMPSDPQEGYTIILHSGQGAPDTHRVSVLGLGSKMVCEFKRRHVAFVSYGIDSRNDSILLRFVLKEMEMGSSEVIRGILQECGHARTQSIDADSPLHLTFYAHSQRQEHFLRLLETWGKNPSRVPLEKLDPAIVSQQMERALELHKASIQRTSDAAKTAKIAMQSRTKDVPTADPKQSLLNFSPLVESADQTTGRRRSGRASTSQYASTLQPPPTTELDATPLDKVVLTYPSGGPGVVTLTHGDTQRLAEGEFLNDTLIDFGLKRIVNQVTKREPDISGIFPDTIHVFSPYFFKKLTQKKKITGKDGQPIDNYTAVKKWTQRFDLFSKKYIIVPINEHMHWYLAIIVNAGAILPHVSSPEVASPPQTRVTRQVAAEQLRVQSESPAISPAPDDTAIRDGPGLLNGVAHASAPDPANASNDGLQDESVSSPESGTPQLEAEDDDAESDLIVSNQLVEGAPQAPAIVQDTGVIDSMTDESTLTEVGSKPPPHLKKTPTPIIPSSHPPDAKSPSPAPSSAPVIVEDTLLQSFDQRCFILVFDSLGNTHPAVQKRLREYLIREAQDKKQISIDRSWAETGIEGVTVNVPLQNNFSDCGLYVLHYVERFLAEPTMLTQFAIRSQRSRKPKDAISKAELEQQVHDLWSGKDAAQKRRIMREEISSLSKEWLETQKPIEEQLAREREEKARKKQMRVEADTARLAQVAAAQVVTLEKQATSQPKKRLRRGQKAEPETLILSDDDEEEEEEGTAAEPTAPAACHPSTSMASGASNIVANEDDSSAPDPDVSDPNHAAARRINFPSPSPLPPSQTQLPTFTTLSGPMPDEPGSATRMELEGAPEAASSPLVDAEDVVSERKSPSPVPKRLRVLTTKTVAKGLSDQEEHLALAHDCARAPTVARHIRFHYPGPADPAQGEATNGIAMAVDENVAGTPQDYSLDALDSRAHPLSSSKVMVPLGDHDLSPSRPDK
ncbi:hypothetical protein OIV83_006419 [Microbotryomycetes sp. JL201]|nr:hypothetical protein OIV83_006419 [Microbotryomycetes sp. JL201]